ncbi:MAG: DNRLRE domain-containing protein, partial [Anaerolineae bacterium]
VLRAGPVGTGQDPGSLPYTKLTTEDPVVPMADNKPTSPITTTPDTYNALPYDEVAFYYADTGLAACTTYAYKVAARDMLGQAAGVSTWMTATVPDTMPPAPPEGMTTTVNHLGGTITVAWQPAADAATYVVYRAETATAGWPGLVSCATTDCWVTMTTTSNTAWIDSSGVYETRYWYVVRALDAPCGSHPPNASAPSLAVSGILHDRVPPGAPGVHKNPDGPEISITPDADTIYSLFFCRFDEDPTDAVVPPMVFIAEVPRATPIFDVSGYYSASVPVSVTCWAQPVDGNGNRGTLTVADQAVTLCPSSDAYTLTTPTLDAILTEQGGTYGWTAVLSWTVDALLPQLQGYRIYRQEGSGSLLPIAGQVGGNLIAPDEATYRDITVKPGEVYTYVLAAVRMGCGAEFATEVRSGARLYTIRPTLDTPDLDACARPISDLTWDNPPAPIEGGIYMRWHHPNGDINTMLAVVYRSLEQDGGYVAITPPFATLTGDYVDTDADRTDYWYVATMLNWATGEIVYQTPPATPASSGTAMASPDALDRFAASEASVPLPETAEAVTTNLGALQPMAATAESVVALGASADATLSGTSPDTPYGGDTTLRLGYATEVMDGVDRALLQFDLSSLPVGSTIDHAALSTYVEGIAVRPEGEPIDIGLRLVSSPWDEGTVTWNTAPSVGGGALTVTIVAPTQWITWNVTELVAAWWSSPGSNYGVMLDSEHLLDHEITLTSREGTPNPPRLTVYYEAPPAVLLFGVAGDNLFEVEDMTYAAGSTPSCLTGDGWVRLGGDGLDSYSRSVSFTCISADYTSGIVTSGTATVALPLPIAIDYPLGFSYSVKSLSLSETTAWGEVDLSMPEGSLFHFSGVPVNPMPLAGVTIHQNLTFRAVRTWASGCASPDPQFSFEMDPLPLKIVPTGGVTLTQSFVDVGMACTLYDERSSLARPPFPLADANDAWLRPSFTAIRPTQITPAGVSGEYTTMAPKAYTTAMPYGFELSVTQGITFEVDANHIANGEMRGLALGLDYYQIPVGKVLTTTIGEVGEPTGRFDGWADQLAVGADGELFGQVWIGLPGNIGGTVAWANGGFRTTDEAYFLYVPPVQTGPTDAPSEAAARAWGGSEDIQGGLNAVAPAPESIAFTWECCTSKEAITFPGGVAADLYLRRGGVSDLVVATITYPGLPTKLYNYDTVVTSFGISFCDNAIYDSDIAGDVDLPYPSDVIVPLVAMTLNPNTACATGGKVNTNKLTLAHWQIDLGPRRAEFRSRTLQPGDPANWTAALWLLGTMDVPHVAPSGSTGQAPIPLESAYKYDGTFLATKVVQDKVNYTFDGFRYLLSGVTFSAYPPLPGEPWIAGATLAAPPSLTGGFVQLRGNLLVPSYGTVQGESSGKPP